MIVSSIGLVEHNEIGGADLDDPANGDLPTCNGASGITFERLQAGTNRYFVAGSGSKIETIKHENPGEIWESFHDRMIRMELLDDLETSGARHSRKGRS